MVFSRSGLAARCESGVILFAHSIWYINDDGSGSATHARISTASTTPLGVTHTLCVELDTIAKGTFDMVGGRYGVDNRYTIPVLGCGVSRRVYAFDLLSQCSDGFFAEVLTNITRVVELLSVRQTCRAFL